MRIRPILFFVLVLNLLNWFVFAAVSAGADSPTAPLATIQSMIDAAADGTTVSIGAGSFNESLTINKNLTLQGVSSSMTIIQAVSGQRVITVTAGHTVTLRNLTLTGGNPSGGVGGGILFDSGYLQIISSRVAGNSAFYGGGLFQNSSSDRVDIVDSQFDSNTATFHGGGIYVKGNIALTNTQVLTNTAGNHGGGLHTDSGHTDLGGGLFIDNRALGGNGGAANVNNSIDISGTQFISNTASQDGGAVLQWNSGQPVNVTNARFERNQTARDGAGLWIRGDATITSSLFLSNTADSKNTTNSHGGGAYLTAGSFRVISSTFAANRAQCTGNNCTSPTGGGIQFETAFTTTVQESLFDSNNSWSGAGINSNNSPTLVQRTIFRSNSGGYGGGISALSVDVQNSDFFSNNVINGGGALNVGSSLIISSTRFISNTTGFDGGGAVRAAGLLTVTNSLFAGNQALGYGAVFRMNNNVTRTLRYVTIAHPSSGNGAAILISGGTLNLTNTIVASYTVGISNTGGIVNADCDLFFGGTATQTSGGSTILGVHNIFGQDPRFVKPASSDFHLTNASPAIGAGTDLGVLTDLDTKARISRYDIGAYQFWSSLFQPLIIR